MSNQYRSLLKQLQPLLASLPEAVHTCFSSTCPEAQQAFQRWQAHYLYLPAHPLHEFCLQTACMQFVHAYFLRICEEYGLLLPYPASERESKVWITRSMQAIRHILGSLDNTTPASIAHCFDWFAPDERTMLQLYQVLKQRNFIAGAGDILGKVYNEGFIEQHNRSDKGQFYTPPHVVQYMLNTLEIPSHLDTHISANDGYKKCRDSLCKTVADLACGSGSFLVAAATRKQAILQHLVAAGDITRDGALNVLTNTVIGFDLNPFACYLATINLFIQCLPLLFDREKYSGNKGVNSRNVEALPPLQFSIHCIDALDVRSMEQEGFASRTFDYLIGNPPYVSANESVSNLLYRSKIWNSDHYQLLSQKWDLFVPFFERNLHMLQPESGRLGLIVSSGIETEGYAQRLRQLLCKCYSLFQIDFFPGLRVFPYTGIESTMVFLKNRPPGDSSFVRRRRHHRANLASFETLPPVRQSAGVEQVFRWRYLPDMAASMTNDSVPLCAIAYIGTGLEAQSSEYAEQVIDGQRHKRFTLSDVFVLPSNEHERPARFPDDGVLGDDIDNYHLRRTRYVAYEHYLPFMRGPRHPALFRTPEKLLLGETSGGYYDTSGLFTNHSVQVVVPWHALEQSDVLQETGIARVLRKSQQISGMIDFTQISRQFDLRYLLAIINSRFIRRYLAANLHRGTRKGRIYPDIWKRLPIKVIPPEQQRQIALLVEAVQDEYKSLAKHGELQNEGGSGSPSFQMLVETRFIASTPGADARQADVMNRVPTASRPVSPGRANIPKVNRLIDEIEMLIEEIYC